MEGAQRDLIQIIFLKFLANGVNIHRRNGFTEQQSLARRQARRPFSRSLARRLAVVH